MSPTPLLVPDALMGRTVGLSVSESADLGRLGLLETHLRLVLGEVTRAVLLAGGAIAYGGRLQPSGYTAFLQHEVEKYGRTDAPLLSCLAWSEHRSISLSELNDAVEDLGLYGTVICLDPDGNKIDPSAGRGEEPEPVGTGDVARGLTGLRRYLTQRTDARVLVGGRRTGFQGHVPGVLEEAEMAIQAGQPIYVAGGFGGVAGDIVRALPIDGAEWLEPVGAYDRDSRATRELDRLAEDLAGGAASLAINGLTADENGRLARAYRPSEIATLVAVGLARLYGPSAAAAQ